MSLLLSFEIPGLPKTTNASNRSHWALKANEARYWKRLVGYKCISQPGFQQDKRFPLKHARLVLTRFSSAEPDGDGIASSFKHVIDGLVDAGVLENDKLSNIGVPDYRWEKVKPKQGRIRVEVYEVPTASATVPPLNSVSASQVQGTGPA